MLSHKPGKTNHMVVFGEHCLQAIHEFCYVIYTM